MKLFKLYLVVALLLPVIVFCQTVVSININGGINPSSAEFINKSIQQAEKENAECLLIHLNTPGGLVTSTRGIVTDILQSKVPIVVYVSPTGAHAGSAGVFITMAANIAAMAPETNMGAAHPVNLQGGMDSTMNEKVMNDAAAFIKTIAMKRGRNAEWAEDAVRNSVSITEHEALEKNVIDIVALNDAVLLDQINGKEIHMSNDTKILHTKNAQLKKVSMGFFQKILDRISDPNVAYILMMLGFYGIMFELFNPGAILPGIAGVIFLIFAFYSMNSMPVNYAGLGLIIFGIILFLLEIKVVSHGMLTIGGVVSVLLGSLILFRTSSTENFISISRSLIFATTAVTTLFFLFVVSMGLKAQRAKPSSGVEVLIGKFGQTIEALQPLGSVKVNGEIWKAESLSGAISENEKIVIKGIKNLTLYVEQVQES
ncbi:MAG TPA: nodulation protein NfeD [Chitinophagaceae bacterium]|nr:nodulation protein NfeD [Chitinophagaceae bacterium]